jgi:subtilisin family serine protease
VHGSAQAPPGDGERLLVTIHYDAADALHGDPGDRYRRPATYGAGPGAEPVLDALAADYALTRVSGWPMRALGVHCEVFTAARGTDVAAIVERLAHDARVDSAEPLSRFHTLTSAPVSYRSLQHALDTLEIDAAHALARGAGVRVAVIDSGIDGAHRDLAGAIDVQRDFAGGAAAAHGTEVAGIIAARDHGGTGMVGVAPLAELVDLRACRGSGAPAAPADCDSFTLAQAVDYAVTAGVDVINLSLAGPYDPLLARLLASADSHGIVVVAAAAAKGDADNFPASLPTVIGVTTLEGGTDADATLRAPGADVLTTFPGNRYDYGSGSSLASAHVAGIVALMRSLDRHASPRQVRATLSSHRPLSAAAVLEDEAAQVARR